eukprot:185026-Prymnesium_polylepis.1
MRLRVKEPGTCVDRQRVATAGVLACCGFELARERCRWDELHRRVHAAAAADDGAWPDDEANRRALRTDLLPVRALNDGD